MHAHRRRAGENLQNMVHGGLTVDSVLAELVLVDHQPFNHNGKVANRVLFGVSKEGDRCGTNDKLLPEDFKILIELRKSNAIVASLLCKVSEPLMSRMIQQ